LNIYTCCTLCRFTHSLTHSLTHGAEPFFRGRQLCSYSRTFQHFMEPEGSLPCSKEPSTGLYPEPGQSNSIHTIPSYLSKIHFNFVHPPTSWSSQWSLSFWLSYQYLICIPLLSIRATCPCVICETLIDPVLKPVARKRLMETVIDRGH
jgi:hypothetical protein